MQKNDAYNVNKLLKVQTNMIKILKLSETRLRNLKTKTHEYASIAR